MAEKITKEFFEKLNNSEIGIYMRLAFFNCSDEILEKMRNISGKPDVTKNDFSLNVDNIFIEFPEIYEIMKKENTFSFNAKNINRIGDTLEIECDYLPSGLNFQNMRHIEWIVKVLGIKQLVLYIEQDVRIDDIQVEYLVLNSNSFINVDIEKLSSVKILELNAWEEMRINFSESNMNYPRLEKIISFSDADNWKLTGRMDEQTLPKIEILPDRYLAKSLEELKIFLNTKYALYNIISYLGTEQIPPELFQNIDEKIILKVTTPLIISDEFCERLKDKENIHIRIEDDCGKMPPFLQSYTGDDVFSLVCKEEDYTLAEISAVNEEIRNILAEAPLKEETDLEKVAYLYEKIGQNVEYARGYTDHSLIGGLLEKKQVCYGYSLEFYILAKELGLESNIIKGIAINRQKNDWLEDREAIRKGYGGYHAWNQIKVDGIWYNIDLTFDSQYMRNGDEPKNFLLSDIQFTCEWKRTNCKRQEKIEDYFVKDKNFDPQAPQKCYISYYREDARQALERQKRRISSSGKIIAGMEEESQGIRTSDILTAERTMIKKEQQQTDDRDETNIKL